MRAITNRKPGTCSKCGSPVPAGAGLALAPATRRGAWSVLCADHADSHRRQIAAAEEDRLAYYGSAERADFYSPGGW